MYRYAKEFRKECIPHISEQDEIVDNIHNYPRPPKKQTTKSDEIVLDIKNSKRVNNVLEHGRPTLKEEDINNAKKEL